MTADLATVWASLQMHLEAHRPDGAGTAGAPGPVTPVCLLTGFLGAGKTSLLVDLLSNAPDGLRVRAIVNDVGGLPFDPTLVSSADDARVELTNGCGCCERTGDLRRTLHDLADRGCDLIVLEASGAADPHALAQVVAADPALRLDRIVAVVRATHLDEQPLPPLQAAIIERQIDSAHCVVLSCCDLHEPAAADAAFVRAADLAPGRTVTRSTRTAPASRVLLPGAPRGARPSPAGTPSQHRELDVVTVGQARELSLLELRAALVDSRPGLLRVKGRLRIDGGDRFVQLTPESLDITEAPPGEHGLTLVAASRDDARRVIELVCPSAIERSITPPTEEVMSG